MGKVFPELDESLRAWIAAQHVFFVATAPCGDAGHINCSPKGLDTFRVLASIIHESDRRAGDVAHRVA